jgi:hypothetical protein
MLSPNSWDDFFGFLRRFILMSPPPDLTLSPVPLGEEEIMEVLDGWPLFEDGPLGEIPKGRRGMIEAYGNPSVTYTKRGAAKVSKTFARRLSTVPADVIAGYHRRIYMHDMVAPYFREAMRRSAMVAPGYVFKSVGCFNPRHMRHDKRRPLSDHTWGIAFDVNAKENRAFYRKPTDPLPFEDGWERFSDLSQSIINAWESVGFTWGGRWGTGKKGGFCDPMHFSLRK